MKANSMVLNPKAKIKGKLKCSHCGEKIVEVSTEHENEFQCGCEELVEFEIPVYGEDDKDNKGDVSGGDSVDPILDGLDSISDDIEFTSCSRCGGTGTVSVYFGYMGGSRECSKCGGTGRVTI